MISQWRIYAACVTRISWPMSTSDEHNFNLTCLPTKVYSWIETCKYGAIFVLKFVQGLWPKNLWANTFPGQPFNNAWENNLKLVLGLLYTRSQGGQKNLGPTLSIFVLQIGPKLLINARTLAPRVANWPPKFDGILFSALGPIQGRNDLDGGFYKPH